jgi:phosphonate transport system ATP-binding protein
VAEPVFELEGVRLRFGSLDALAGIDLRIDEGERVAVIGPSGAGKSSLLALLNGTLAPSEGVVRVFGRDLARLSPRELRTVRRELGTIHQRLDLVGPLRVVHNANAGRLGRWPLPTALLSLVFPRGTGDVAAALDRVGIPDKLYERTERLSGGEQQRVAIARVLLQGPRATLADEPIASLDPERAREILDLLLGLSGELGGTLVTSLHDVAAATSRFDRLVGLRGGRVVFDTAPDALAAGSIGELYAIEARA